MSDKVAVVTGSNKGIGLGIVRELCRRGVSVVYLTARDTKRGLEAVENLKKEDLNPLFHQLEVTDRSSVEAFAEHVAKTHGGIDILINNAGMATTDSLKTTYEDSLRVIETNYRSLLTVQEYLFPILKDNARVINVSSNCGHISNLKNPFWIKVLTKDDLTRKDIDDFVNWFLNAVRNEELSEKDFAEMTLLAYRISKIAVSALTRVQQREVGRGISVNSFHPGFVKTDLTRNLGDLTMEEASKTPAYLALDIDQSVTGKYFWFDKAEMDWADPNLKLYLKYEELVNANKAAMGN